MLKAYVSSHKYRGQPGERGIFDVGFDPRPEKALYYPTREEAEDDCRIIYNTGTIQIDTSEGLKHTLKDFTVEQRGPSEFVIFCEGPFVNNAKQASGCLAQEKPE